MSIIRGLLTERAVLFTIDLSQSTASHQPIETLVPTGLTLAAKFKPKKTFSHYLTGQLAETDDIILTEREISLNNVLEIDSIKYRVVRVQTLKSPGQYGNRIMGYSAKVALYHH